MLVEKIDVVGAEAAQRALERGADVFGPAVELPVAVVEGEAELGRDDDLVPERLERLPDDLAELAEASTQVKIVGERYPEAMQQMVDR